MYLISQLWSSYIFDSTADKSTVPNYGLFLFSLPSSYQFGQTLILLIGSGLAMQKSLSNVDFIQHTHSQKICQMRQEW